MDVWRWYLYHYDNRHYLRILGRSYNIWSALACAYTYTPITDVNAYFASIFIFYMHHPKVYSVVAVKEHVYLNAWWSNVFLLLKWGTAVLMFFFLFTSLFPSGFIPQWDVASDSKLMLSSTAFAYKQDTYMHIQ